MNAFHWHALIKGVLEGFSEFLPISSTGHLILVRDSLPLTGNPARADDLNNFFDIVVQLPAILAIVVLYWQRLWVSVRDLPSRPEPKQFWLGLIAAFCPAAMLGAAFHDKIEKVLEKPGPVAVALIAGGIILILIERRSLTSRIQRAEDVPLGTALLIGFYQCLALFPGTSRSGATIIGARLSGLNRAAAAEFSFFLALPTMFGACAYKMYKAGGAINWSLDGPVLAIGCAASFVTAALVVYWFIRFVQHRSLAIFGWYRILLGLAVLLF